MQPDSQSFFQRAELTEWMDEPCSYEEFRACLRDLVRVNRFVFAYRPTLDWIEEIAVKARRPLHIVDVGSGAGDMLRRIERWARDKQIAVQLTGIDLNPYAARAAREFSSAASCIEWITCDAHNYKPTTRVDVVISSLFTHHLSDAEIIRFLEWMERRAELGWFINDLERARRSYFGFKVLAYGMRWHRFVRHDGPVSIQRSFSTLDWLGYIKSARLDAANVRIAKARPGRLCVARVKR